MENRTKTENSLELYHFFSIVMSTPADTGVCYGELKSLLETCSMLSVPVGVANPRQTAKIILD